MSASAVNSAEEARRRWKRVSEKIRKKTDEDIEGNSEQLDHYYDDNSVRHQLGQIDTAKKNGDRIEESILQEKLAKTLNKKGLYGFGLKHALATVMNLSQKRTPMLFEELVDASETLLDCLWNFEQCELAVDAAECIVSLIQSSPKGNSHRSAALQLAFHIAGRAYYTLAKQETVLPKKRRALEKARSNFSASLHHCEDLNFGGARGNELQKRKCKLLQNLANVEREEPSRDVASMVEYIEKATSPPLCCSRMDRETMCCLWKSRAEIAHLAEADSLKTLYALHFTYGLVIKESKEDARELLRLMAEVYLNRENLSMAMTLLDRSRKLGSGRRGEAAWDEEDEQTRQMTCVVWLQRLNSLYDSYAKDDFLHRQMCQEKIADTAYDGGFLHYALGYYRDWNKLLGQMPRVQVDQKKRCNASESFAFVYSKLGRHQDAKNVLLGSLEMSDDDQKATLYHRLAECAESLNESSQEVVNFYRKAWKFFPNQPDYSKNGKEILDDWKNYAASLHHNDVVGSVDQLEQEVCLIESKTNFTDGCEDDDGEDEQNAAESDLSDILTPCKEEDFEALIDDIEDEELVLLGPNKRNQHNENDLHVQCRRGNEDLVESLLETKEYCVNAADRGGWRPIHEAANHGNAGCIRLLLKYGAEVDVAAVAVGSEPGRSLANVGSRELGAEGQTALMDAAQAGHLDSMEVLRQKGASALRSDKDGVTAVDYLERYLKNVIEDEGDEMQNRARFEKMLDDMKAEQREGGYVKRCTVPQRVADRQRKVRESRNCNNSTDLYRRRQAERAELHGPNAVVYQATMNMVRRPRQVEETVESFASEPEQFDDVNEHVDFPRRSAERTRRKRSPPVEFVSVRSPPKRRQSVRSPVPAAQFADKPATFEKEVPPRLAGVSQPQHLRPPLHVRQEQVVTVQFVSEIGLEVPVRPILVTVYGRNPTVGDLVKKAAEEYAKRCGKPAQIQPRTSGGVDLTDDVPVERMISKDEPIVADVTGYAYESLASRYQRLCATRRIKMYGNWRKQLDIAENEKDGVLLFGKESFGGDRAVPLFVALQTANSLRVLDLSNNSIKSNEAFEEMGRALCQLNGLERLGLDGVGMEPHHLTRVLSGMTNDIESQHKLLQLKTLDVSNNLLLAEKDGRLSASVGDDFCALLKRFPSLCTLKLRVDDEKLIGSPANMSSFFNPQLTKTLCDLKELKSLDLAGNRMDSELLCNFLVFGVDRCQSARLAVRLVEFDLSATTVTDDSPGIVTALQAFFQDVASVCKLEVLQLNKCKFISDDLRTFAELMSQLSSLRIVGLEETNIDDTLRQQLINRSVT